MKTHVLYNQVGLFIGPAPSNTGHFLDQNGNISMIGNTGFNNLVLPINRVTQVSYGWSEPRTDVKSLGYYGTLKRPILVNIPVNLSFSYYLMGCLNESRLGFLVNHPPSGNIGDGIYGSSVNTFPISGFIDRSFNRSNDNSIGWPLTYRDSHNFFVATQKDFSDLNDYTGNYFYKSSQVNTFAFGDCFLNNYKVSASVSQIPVVSVDFICNNLVYYDGGSGKIIPSLNPKDKSLYTGTLFNLPNTFQGNNIPTVLLPSDLTVDISSIPSGSYLSDSYSGSISNILDSFGRRITLNEDTDIVNLPFNLDDIKIQSFDIELSLNREPLYNLGYKLPLDRPINFPVFANLNFSAVVGESATGSLLLLINKDRDYDIDIKLKYQRNQSCTGVGMMYRFLTSKFNGMNISDSVGTYRTINFSFTTELKPDNNLDGFFMSGQLGVIPLTRTDATLLGDDFNSDNIVDELLTEDGQGIIIIPEFDQILY